MRQYGIAHRQAESVDTGGDELNAVEIRLSLTS
jgi:hypothetical protein